MPTPVVSLCHISSISGTFKHQSLVIAHRQRPNVNKSGGVEISLTACVLSLAIPLVCESEEVWNALLGMHEAIQMGALQGVILILRDGLDNVQPFWV